MSNEATQGIPVEKGIEVEVGAEEFRGGLIVVLTIKLPPGSFAERMELAVFPVCHNVEDAQAVLERMNDIVKVVGSKIGTMVSEQRFRDGAKS